MPTSHALEHQPLTGAYPTDAVHPTSVAQRPKRRRPSGPALGVLIGLAICLPFWIALYFLLF
jgi:hypothetical protein